ncbi:gas vesicle protein K [Candidatus Bathyarchaeota archaeon]|nr:gas vesicle protein K [Candidatus Bathyarchaeota archaeon]
MVLDIDEKNLKNGVLGLVLALVEIIRDALRIQALKRMESGTLTDQEMERLGEAFMDMDIAIEEIKKEHGMMQSVQAIRDGLDDLVNEMLLDITDPSDRTGALPSNVDGRGVS